MQQAFQINGLELLTPAKRLVETPCVFAFSPNLVGKAEKNKAAQTAIWNGFGIHKHNGYSIADSSAQEVRA